MDASLTKSQQRAYKAIMSGLNVFLTGHAGTGKSYLLNIVRHELSDAGKNVVVAAPTGIAGIVILGALSWLWKLFGLDFRFST
jgi:predicted AAA+ superfamily ATPase